MCITTSAMEHLVEYSILMSCAGIKIIEEPVVELPANYVPPGPLIPVTERLPLEPVEVSYDV